MKYMVMECHFSYAVVLDEAGRFLKVANRQYEVGQTVTDVIEMQAPQPAAQKKNTNKWISSLAAMAACLVLVMSMMFFRAPYASVYLTINPEVRIDVNRSDVVVGVEGMNDDGTDLLNGYDHRKKDLDTVMDELVDLAIEMGYLHEGGKITISLDADEEWVTSHGEQLNQHLNEHLTDRITVTIDVEQKQSAPAPEAAPGETFVIPVTPENYGESDYGDDDSDDADSGYSGDEGDSSYDASDNGQSDYDDNSDDAARSDYADAQSNYADSSDDDAQSNYDDSSDDEGQSNYDDSSDDDIQSNYGDVSDGGGQSIYGSESEDSDSGYQSAPDDGQSGYGDSFYDEDEGQPSYDSDPNEQQSDYEEDDD